VSGWVLILVASAGCFAIKFAGHLLPTERLTDPRVVRASGLVTVCLLSALVAVQTLAHGRVVVLDARVPALAVAAVALLLRAPFVAVVLAAAATAAALRALGWGS